jgi:hypothetical protein
MELGAERAGAPGGGLASVVVAASYVELGFWGGWGGDGRDTPVRFPTIDDVVGVAVGMVVGGGAAGAAVVLPRPWVAGGRWAGPEGRGVEGRCGRRSRRMMRIMRVADHGGAGG